MAIYAISGKKTAGKNLLALIIQYHIYCKKMLALHPNFNYSIEAFAQQVVKPNFKFTKEECGWELKSMAGKLKQCASIILNVPIEKFEDQNFKLSYLPSCWDRFFWRDHRNRRHRIEYDKENPDGYEREVMTVRQFLQLFGTEGCRDGVHDNFWVNALMSDYIDQEPLNFKVDVVHPNWIITDTRFINEVDAFKKYAGSIFRINRKGIDTSDTHPSEVGLDNYIPDILINNDGSIIDLIKQVKEAMLDHNLI